MKANEPQYLVRIVASIRDNKFNCFHIRASLLASNCGRRFRRPFPIKSSASGNEIVAYQKLFYMVTLLGSSSNHDDGEGNVKIK